MSRFTSIKFFMLTALVAVLSTSQFATAQSLKEYVYKKPSPRLTVTDSPGTPQTPTDDVNPSPANDYLSLSPDTVSFGYQPMGSTSDAVDVVVTNIGVEQVQITGISVDKGADVFNQSNTCGAPLEIGESCIVSVAMTPNGTARKTGSIYIANTSQAGAMVIPLNGTGVDIGNSAFYLSEPFLDFRVQHVKTTREVRVTNSSAGFITITFSGFPRGFESGGPTEVDCQSRQLAPDEWCTFSVAMTDALGDGRFKGNFLIYGNGQHTALLPLSGRMDINPEY